MPPSYRLAGPFEERHGKLYLMVEHWKNKRGLSPRVAVENLLAIENLACNYSFFYKIILCRNNPYAFRGVENPGFDKLTLLSHCYELENSAVIFL